MATKAGITERTLKRAAKRLGVFVDSRGYPRKTTWTLPIHKTHPRPQNLGPTSPTEIISGNMTPLAHSRASWAKVVTRARTGIQQNSTGHEVLDRPARQLGVPAIQQTSHAGYNGESPHRLDGEVPRPSCSSDYPDPPEYEPSDSIGNGDDC